MTRPIPGAKRGRPRTSPGWTTIGIRLPRPTVEAFRALPDAVQARVRAALKGLIEAAID